MTDEKKRGPGRPRKAPEARHDPYRRYPGEDGYKEPRGRKVASAVPAKGKRRTAPRCEYPSLGPQVWEWIAEHLRVPDGPYAGAPLQLTGDQSEVLFAWYRLDDAGMFVFRRGCWRAAQGSGKSPMVAAIALAELVGPTRFEGWDAKGRPVGVVPGTPLVQLAASSADQSENTYRAAYLMAAESDLAGVQLDIGRTKIHRIGAPGSLESVTAAAGSRLGQRLTFAVLDETHLWNRRNGGLKLADVLRRNATKMAGRTFETSNAHAIGEDSVSERTYAAALEDADGLLYVANEAPAVANLTDFNAVRGALSATYGDAASDRGGWVNLDRMAADIADPGADPDSVRRYFFNQLTSGGETPMDIERWEGLADLEREVADGARIALGFDGSISEDETVLYGCTADGFVFLVGAWSRPENAPKGWRVPRDEVHAKVADACERFDVGRMFADPPRWWSELDEWVGLYGEEVVLALDTNSGRRFAPLCDAFATAINEGQVSHDGNVLLTQHLAACARKQVRQTADPEDGRTAFVVVKADTRKIDRAVAAILALGAAQSMPAAPPRVEPLAAWV